MNRYALITGASGGIGRAITKQLAEEGYNLYLHYHQNKQSITKLMEEIQSFGGDYIPICANLSSIEGYKKVAEEVFAIDTIIYNSGTSYYGLFDDTPIETIDSLLQIHVRTPMLLIQNLLSKMLRNRFGNVIFVSSIWGQTGAACEVAYSTVKGAQLAFVKSLSKEVAASGVRVNAVAPGAVNTPMLQDFTEDELDELQSEIPIGRLAQPEEIAKAISFLASPNSSYITGQTLAINGGWYT